MVRNSSPQPQLYSDVFPFVIWMFYCSSVPMMLVRESTG